MCCNISFAMVCLGWVGGRAGGRGQSLFRSDDAHEAEYGREGDNQVRHTASCTTAARATSPSALLFLSYLHAFKLHLSSLHLTLLSRPSPCLSPQPSSLPHLSVAVCERTIDDNEESAIFERRRCKNVLY
jgi:hypothetical protein